MPSRKITLSLGAASLIATVFSLPMLLQAQDHEEAPTAQSLMERLENDYIAFAARVDGPVDLEMLELGRRVAVGGGESEGAQAGCVSCHGAKGQGKAGQEGDGSEAVPRLAGQAGWYSYKQLSSYASGSRSNEVMSGIASKLTEIEMEAVSAYYAVIEAPYPDLASDVDQDVLQRGEQIATIGSSELGIPSCTNCHGPQGTGLPPSVPYLTGQYPGYMTHQLELWRDGVRDNDVMNIMSTIATKMSDEDMRAISEYYARVRPQSSQADRVAPNAPDLSE